MNGKILYLLLAILAFGIYANSLGNGFVWDDHVQLLNNPMVLDWSNIPDIFQHDVWAYASEVRSHYYRPIQLVVYMALQTALGFNPFFFHLAMLLIHTANTLLVFHLSRRMLARPDAALVAGIIFAVHPIHNEPVVWIAALPDLLMTLLVLVSMILWVRCEARPRPPQIAGLAGLYFLALLTKETGAMLLPLLAGYEFLFLGRRPWKNWRLYGALSGVVAVYALLRFHALGGIGILPGGAHDLHGRVLLLSIITLLGQYLGRLVVPTHLNFYHHFTPTVSVNLWVILCLAVELGIVAAIVLLRAREEDAGKAPLISYSLLFILLPLAPVLSINSVGDNVFAERYLYLPSVGFAMLAAMAWGWLAGDIQAQSASRFADRQRIAAWSVVAMVVAASAWILLPRNLVWHDDYQLIRAGLDESPNNAVLLRSFSAFYAERKQYDVAIEFLQRATAADPHLLDAWVNLGGAYEATHRDAEALAAFRKAVELDPEDPHMYAAHFDLGLLYERTNSWDAAAMEFSKSLQLMPDFDAGKDALKRAQEMIKQRPDKKPF